MITKVLLQKKMHCVINDQDVITNFTRLNLTHEDLALCFRLLLLVGLPSIFLYMACSAPLCSECFFTSLESSEWIVCREETRQIGAAGSKANNQTCLKYWYMTTRESFPLGRKGVRMTRASHKQTRDLQSIKNDIMELSERDKTDAWPWTNHERRMRLCF